MPIVSHSTCIVIVLYYPSQYSTYEYIYFFFDKTEIYLFYYHNSVHIFASYQSKYCLHKSKVYSTIDKFTIFVFSGLV